MNGPSRFVALQYVEAFKNQEDALNAFGMLLTQSPGVMGRLLPQRLWTV